MNTLMVCLITAARTARFHRTAVAVLLFSGLFVQSALAQGTLIGTVTNSATGRTLEGARVEIRNTNFEALTDSLGVYRFANLPAGNVTLRVSYTGLSDADVSVAIAPGAANRHDVGLTASIYRMDKFVVSGQREGLAQAITLQKLSDGIKNVVSTDAFGSVGGNPADIVGRLPGVNTTGFEGDTRYVQIRGLNQNLSTVTMDGNRLADAAFGGTSRSYSFQMIGSDSFERIEVTKLPTPDMDGDSIAGAVNLVSKSAFDSSPERRISGSLGAAWRPFDDRESSPLQSYSLNYSEVFAGRFGITVNAAYRPHHSFQDGMTLSRENKPAGVAGPRHHFSFNIEDFRMERIRSNLAIKLDYKHSDTTRFFINLQYNKHLEHEQTFNQTWESNQVVATVGPGGALTGTGGIVPGYTDTSTTIRPLPTSVLSINPGLLYLISTAQNLSFGGVHRYSKWDINYDVYQSMSKNSHPGGNRGVNYQIENLGWTFTSSTDSTERYYPTITQTAGPDVTRLSSYRHTLYNENDNIAWDKYLGSTLHVKRRFDTVVPTSIKAGFRSREQDRILEREFFNTQYVGADRVSGLNPATGRNDDDLSLFGQANPKQGGKLTRYPKYPFAATPNSANQFFRQVRSAHPEWFQDNVAAITQNPLVGNQKFNEQITGWYLQGDVKLGKLTVLGGFRVENTEVTAEGSKQQVSPAEAALRAAWVGPVTDAEQRRRSTAEFSGRQTVKGEYRYVLPGLHFKYSPTRGIVTRLGYATNIGRPAIGTLIPTTNVNDTNRTVSISNPKLRPQTADNFDLAAEYYFEPAGLISAGVFLKEMKNFIFTSGGATIGTGQDNGFDGQYAGYSLTTQYNGLSSKVRGFELNYTQQFTFLPGFWSGFGIFANYTRLQAEGFYGAGGAISLTNNNTLPTSPTKELAGFVPNNANLGISYIRRGTTVRVNFGYRGRFLNGYNASQSLLVYTLPWPTVDIRAAYRFSRRFEAYFDVNNVLNEPYLTREYYGGAARALGLNSPQLLFGITGRL